LVAELAIRDLVKLLPYYKISLHYLIGFEAVTVSVDLYGATMAT
jgi:hypothetical protein